MIAWACVYQFIEIMLHDQVQEYKAPEREQHWANQVQPKQRTPYLLGQQTQKGRGCLRSLACCANATQHSLRQEPHDRSRANNSSGTGRIDTKFYPHGYTTILEED